MPQRIQQRRTKGWRKPEGAVAVGRPGRWGNPWIGGGDRDAAVRAFRYYIATRSRPGGGTGLVQYPSDAEIRTELAGKDLMCWCPLDQPCHADVLLDLANRPAGEV